MITVRFWFGNLFATWIFVVLISSWRNSTLSVRSSDMSSSKRGIVFNEDEERTELVEMVVLDVGSINWICFWDRKETKNSSQRADVNIKYQVNIKWRVLASTSYSWNLKSKLGTRHQKNGALPSGSKWSVKGAGGNIWGSVLPRRLDTDGQELCGERFNRSFWPTCYERFEWNGRSGKKLPFCQLLTNFLIEPKFKQQWRMFLFTEMIFHTLPGIEMSPHDSLTEGVKKALFF